VAIEAPFQIYRTWTHSLTQWTSLISRMPPPSQPPSMIVSILSSLQGVHFIHTTQPRYGALENLLWLEVTIPPCDARRLAELFLDLIRHGPCPTLPVPQAHMDVCMEAWTRHIGLLSSGAN
jgi:hypothetical protein